MTDRRSRTPIRLLPRQNGGVKIQQGPGFLMLSRQEARALIAELPALIADRQERTIQIGIH